MLRAIRHRLGPNPEPDKACQVRIYCIYPTKVRIPWKDNGGKDHLYTWSTGSGARVARAIEKQMEDFSDLIFRISWGRICIRYKVRPARTPLERVRRGQYGYYVSPGSADPLVLEQNLRPGEAMIIFLWVPIDGEGDFPPRGGVNAIYAPGRFQGKLGPEATKFNSFYTTLERLEKDEGWTSLKGGLPHEFWHSIKSFIKNPGGFKGELPSIYRGEDFRALQEEIRAQGLPVPKYQYEDLYPTFLTWRICSSIERKCGRIPNWGQGPRVSATVKEGD